MITIPQINAITRSTTYADRKAGFLRVMQTRGGDMVEPAIFAQMLAQVLHESGAFRYVTEIWGPTPAQIRYEGRRDLGNVQRGDGRRYMGRDLIQITGRANYHALSKWVGFDFEANPDALAMSNWLGIGVIWYFVTRPDLMRYCRAGNIEMVTRLVNGGLNGYPDRLQWYDRTALVMLNAPNIREFQRSMGLQADGISGPITRAAFHRELEDLA